MSVPKGKFNDFNSTLVRLTDSLFPGIDMYVIDFNSTLVRLTAFSSITV